MRLLSIRGIFSLMMICGVIYFGGIDRLLSGHQSSVPSKYLTGHDLPQPPFIAKRDIDIDNVMNQFSSFGSFELNRDSLIEPLELEDFELSYANVQFKAPKKDKLLSKDKKDKNKDKKKKEADVEVPKSDKQLDLKGATTKPSFGFDSRQEMVNKHNKIDDIKENILGIADKVLKKPNTHTQKPKKAKKQVKPTPKPLEKEKQSTGLNKILGTKNKKQTLVDSTTTTRDEKKQSMNLSNQTITKESKPKPFKKPNVLFISIDDLNMYVSILDGHPNASTPALEELGSRGVTFTNAHASATHCHPSRASILTGYSANSLQIFSNRGPRLREVYPDILTLPQYFQKAGYRTFGSGKIFHGKDRDPISWNASFLPDGHDQLNQIGITGDKLLDWGLFNRTRARHPLQDDQVVGWALDRLREEESIRSADDEREPFFMAVGFRYPHVPWFLPEEEWSRIGPARDLANPPGYLEGDTKDLPVYARDHVVARGVLEKLKSENKWADVIRGYLAAIAATDSRIGRLAKELNELKVVGENTLIVVWSDHGFHLGEKEHVMKDTLWEPTSRVPLLFAGRGVKKGIKVESLAGLVDVLPTLVDLCGLPHIQGLEGVSLAHHLLEKNDDNGFDYPMSSDDVETSSEHVHSSSSVKERDEFEGILVSKSRLKHALRAKDWRYIIYHDGSEELYHNKVDPYEWTNLANATEYGDVKKKLRESLLNMLSIRLDPKTGTLTRVTPKPQWAKEDLKEKKKSEGHEKSDSKTKKNKDLGVGQNRPANV